MKNFLAVGNEELGEKVGTKIRCTRCKKMHVIKYGKRKEGNKWVPSTMLGFVNCGKKAYLVAINGQKFKRG